MKWAHSLTMVRDVKADSSRPDVPDYIRVIDVNGKPVRFLVDTGSEATVLTKATSDRLKLNHTSTSGQVLATNGTDLAIRGECEVYLSNHDLHADATVFISDNAKVNLLGKQEINALKLLGFADDADIAGELDAIASHQSSYITTMQDTSVHKAPVLPVTAVQPVSVPGCYVKRVSEGFAEALNSMDSITNERELEAEYKRLKNGLAARHCQLQRELAMSKGKNADNVSEGNTAAALSPSDSSLHVATVTDSQTTVTEGTSSHGRPDVRPPGSAASSAPGQVASEVLLSNSFMALSGLDDQDVDVKLEERGVSPSEPNVDDTVQGVTGSGDQRTGPSDQGMETDNAEKEPDAP